MSSDIDILPNDCKYVMAEMLDPLSMIKLMRCSTALYRLFRGKFNKILDDFRDKRQLVYFLLILLNEKNDYRSGFRINNGNKQILRFIYDPRSQRYGYVDVSENYYKWIDVSLKGKIVEIIESTLKVDFDHLGLKISNRGNLRFRKLLNIIRMMKTYLPASITTDENVMRCIRDGEIQIPLALHEPLLKGHIQDPQEMLMITCRRMNDKIKLTFPYQRKHIWTLIYGPDGAKLRCHLPNSSLLIRSRK